MLRIPKMIGVSVAFSIAAVLSMGMETPTIQSSNSKLLLAIKWVSYSNGGKPLVSRAQAASTVRKVNHLYAPCGIQFRLEHYIASDESRFGLALHPSKMADLDRIRAKYDDGASLVVITTGKWNHQGGLGADGANAWTVMPGQKPTGTVIEGPLATSAGLIAHELGHALDLDHVSDQSNLMNPVIYSSSTRLSGAQCQTMRTAAITARAQALRDFSHRMRAYSSHTDSPQA